MNQKNSFAAMTGHGSVTQVHELRAPFPHQQPICLRARSLCCAVLVDLHLRCKPFTSLPAPGPMKSNSEIQFYQCLGTASSFPPKLPAMARAGWCLPPMPNACGYRQCPSSLAESRILATVRGLGGLHGGRKVLSSLEGAACSVL